MADNESASQNIRQWALGFKEFAAAGPEMAANVAQIMKAEVDRSVALGQSVDGVKWKPKKDGGRALVNAAQAVTARAIGTVAVITLQGVEVFHHFGAGRVPRRPILPSGGTDRLGNAIRRGLVTMCDQWMTRTGRHDKGAKGHKWKPTIGGGT